MESDWSAIFVHLSVAVVAGGLIGLERSYHGRPAGFRTHTLVSLASCVLMLLTVYHERWFATAIHESVRIDPTRMAQGVMTGIGFLGAGVIMREGLTVRGLTTAASIWITAAIGILAGVGFNSAVMMATAMTLGVLAIFRRIESRMRAQVYAHHTLLFKRDNVPPEPELREFLASSGFTAANISYSLQDRGEHLECRMTIRTNEKTNIEQLKERLLKSPDVVEFTISLSG
ncbi:MgtC/SapB family protein [Geomonas sp. Red32]|uniref:MgtC/SapB family protein n=1 Tax=Geomonas sp. Red32 TaxID=2912856 RepID=UPI00202CD2CB|nr:MgtC/SapB family protein [Geomonas sp. Red32]MCM0080696.1 MgtC/SapB family protein [Geomonas sp. Red32]